LAAQSIRSLREIDVETIGDIVVLRGRVWNFHQRQLALALCKRVAGVRVVRDQLEVAVSGHKQSHPARNPVQGNTRARPEES
jgi:osmotically-inducible protein OsmY